MFPHLMEGTNMAVDMSGGHPAMDYPEHERTYRGFMAFTKYSIIGLVALLVLMAYFLV